MAINFKSIFSMCEKRAHLNRPVTFSESFLRFASYAENNDSIFPYWKKFSERDKFTFIDDCLMNAGKVKERNYIIDHKKEFWSYLIDNTEFSRKDYLDRDENYYIPGFSACCFGVLVKLKLMNDKFPWGYEKFVFDVSSCETVKDYFTIFCDKLDSLFPKWEGIFVKYIDKEITKTNLPIIKKSIFKAVDKLIISK